MIFLLLCLSFVHATETVDYREARLQFLQDTEAYSESISRYMLEATKYRNIKMNEEYRQKIVLLEKELTNGNKEVLKTVISYQSKNKDQILLDDVLLMRLAQLEFEKANFDFNESLGKANSTVTNPNYVKSLEFATRLLRQYPNSSLADSAEYLIAYIYEEQADFDKAQAIYSYFLKKYPVSQYYDEVQWRLAELQFESGNIKEARRNYLELAKRENSKFEFKALYKLGATLFEGGLFDWSSKMFVRLYDRLKNDTVSSAERSTLYDETLEYLGLLQRKGISLQLPIEVEALSAKKIQSIFARHGLWKESEKVISDFVTKYPTSKYLPEMYSRWIALYEERGQQVQAEEIRSQYFAKIIDTKEWWVANRDNHQERFIAEEQIELNLLSSARFLVAQRKWDKAAERFKAFISQYPYDPKTIDARIELAEVYYQQQKFSLAYRAVEEEPAAVMTNSQKDNYNYIKLSSYYALALRSPTTDTVNTTYQLAKKLVKDIKNIEKGAVILKPVAELLISNKATDKALEILGQVPYADVEYASASIISLIELHARLDKKHNSSRSIASLQQVQLDVGLKKLFNLSPFITKSFKTTYDNLNYYLATSDISAFQEVNVEPIIKNDSDREVYALMKSQALRGAGKYVESNAALDAVASSRLVQFKYFLIAKNLYDLVDFVGCQMNLAKIKDNRFKAEYPEFYKLSYDVTLVTKGARAANSLAIQLAAVLKSEKPVVDHMFRLPVDQHATFLAEASKSVAGELVKAFTSKKICNGTIECIYSRWLKENNTDDVITAILELNDARWALAILSLGPSKIAVDSRNTIRDWLAKNQMRFSMSATPSLLATLTKWKIPSKDVVIPWDVAMHEWIDWQGNPSVKAELQILLQEERYSDLEEKLVASDQRRTQDSGLNLLKFYLFTQNREKSQKIFADIKDYIELPIYQSMSYVLGFSSDYVQVPDSDNAFVVVAKAKSQIMNGNVREAIRTISMGIQNDSTSKIYYHTLLQALLLLRDDVGASIVVKKALRNTDSVFANVVEAILEGSTYVKSNIKSIDALAVAVTEKTEVNIPLDSFSFYVSATQAWFAAKTIKTENKNTFEGLDYLTAAVNKTSGKNISNPLFTKTLSRIQRNIASEGKE